MTFSKKSIAAAALQRQLNQSRYTAIWSLMHKIQTATGKRDDLYESEDRVEFNEGCFEIDTKKRQKEFKARPW